MKISYWDRIILALRCCSACFSYCSSRKRDHCPNHCNNIKKTKLLKSGGYDAELSRVDHRVRSSFDDTRIEMQCFACSVNAITFQEALKTKRQFRYLCDHHIAKARFFKLIEKN